MAAQSTQDPANGLDPGRGRQSRLSILLTILLTILCVEGIATALVYLGCGVSSSLGIAVGAGIAYLALPILRALAVRAAAGIRKTARAVGIRLRDKRTYQFSLRALLLAVFLFSIPCAWYGHRIGRVRAERDLLDGKWRRVSEEGVLLVLPTGEPRIVEFAGDGYSVDPNHEPRWLDFHAPGGTSHAIYRWEGARLRVMQVSPGVRRPTSFDQETVDLRVEPGANLTQFGVSTYLLERLPE
jgi:hypothetical protein